MKKKTITTAAALGVLVSSIPVHAMPAEDVQRLVNPPSNANPAVDKMNVYTSFTGGNHNNSGNGSAKNPYNRFEDAVANVEDGGTIYIDSSTKAFLNDVGENMPFLIDKNITIKPANNEKNATLSVNSAGIILGANVRFENITLDFGNRYHDSIFANGYTLDLINVTRNDGMREVDLFAGGLYVSPGNPVHPSGNKGVINVETNGDFGGGILESKFGNIYAGSMNGEFNGTAEINLSQKDKSKKLEIGAIKASGALEAYVSDNFFDGVEPLPPKENPELFPMKGNVSINLDNYQVDVDGATGSNEKTKVTASFGYPTELNLKDVNHLEVASGKVKVMNMNTIPNVTMGDDATLDLTNLTEVTIDNYDGNGIVVLNKNGKLNITNPMKGSMVFQADGSTYFGESERVNENHVYITTPNEDADISFTPHNTQENLDLVGIKKGSVIEWTTKKVSTESVDIKGFVFEDGKDSQTKTYDEINSGDSGYTKFPFKITTNKELTIKDYVYIEDYGFDITVNGEKAVYREDENDYFVSELGLSLYFISEYNDYDHELVVTGSDANGKPIAINTGDYKINVSNGKAEFSTNLTVTDGNEVEPPVVEDEEETNPTPPENEGDNEGEVDSQPPLEGEDTEQPSTNVNEQIYLSDLGFVANKTNANWRPAKLNQNIDGGTISLIVDGERTAFEKGVSAHATSNVVFDISQHSKEYPRLVTYMGVDASQNGNGNGVYFVISTSEDGNEWTEVKTTKVVKGNNESIYLDLNVEGVKFIKFHANNNGSDGSDHAGATCC